MNAPSALQQGKVMRAELAQAVAQESVRAAPPVVVSAFTIAGHGMQDWVYVATFLFIVMQACFLGYRWYRLAFTRQRAPATVPRAQELDE